MSQLSQPDLHVVLIYNGFTITAALYNRYNELVNSPNLTYTFVAPGPSYTWFRNGIPIPYVSGPTITIQPPVCFDEYTVSVNYTVDTILVGIASAHDVVINDDVQTAINIFATLNHRFIVNGNVAGQIIINAGIGTSGALIINGIVASTAFFGDILGTIINGNSSNACAGTDLTFSAFTIVSGTLTNYKFVTVGTLGTLNITGTGVLNNLGSVTSTGAIITVPFSTGTINNSGFITFNTTGSLTNGSVLNNTGAGRINFNDTSVFTNNGIINSSGSSIIALNSTIASTNTFTIILRNNASFRLTVGTLTNGGSITANDYSNFTISGTGNVLNNGLLTLNNNAYLVIINTAATINNNTTGTIVLNNNASVNINDGGFINQGTLTVAGSNAIINLTGVGSLDQNLAGAVITNNGFVNIYDTVFLVVSDGTINNNNIINLYPGGNIIIYVPAVYNGNDPIGFGNAEGVTSNTTTLNNTTTGTVIARTTYSAPNFANTILYGAMTGSLSSLSSLNNFATLTSPQGPTNQFIPNTLTVNIIGIPPSINNDVYLIGTGTMTLHDNMLIMGVTNVQVSIYNLQEPISLIVCTPVVSSNSINGTIIIGTDIIINNTVLSQRSHNGKVFLEAIIPFTAVDIIWNDNYAPSSFIGHEHRRIIECNGIYELSFFDPSICKTTVAIIEITTATPANYFKFVGDHGHQLYGSLVGFPPDLVPVIKIVSIGAGSKIRIYIDNMQISSNLIINVAKLKQCDTILVIITNCCTNAETIGSTFKLKCCPPVNHCCSPVNHCCSPVNHCCHEPTKEHRPQCRKFIQAPTPVNQRTSFS